MDEHFPNGKLTPPGHPQCRCVVDYVEIPAEAAAGHSSSVRGLGAGNGNSGVAEHAPPEYLGTLDDLSEEMVQSTLRKYEKEIVDSGIENAVVITKQGAVWRCYGDKNNVYPNVDLGAEALQGAWVTHNHPIGSDNEYSFSGDDINLFMEYALKVLRGIDEFFVYELTRDPREIDKHIPVMEYDEFSASHERVIMFAEQIGIGYRRWRRD